MIRPSKWLLLLHLIALTIIGINAQNAPNQKSFNIVTYRINPLTLRFISLNCDDIAEHPEVALDTISSDTLTEKLVEIIESMKRNGRSFNGTVDTRIKIRVSNDAQKDIYELCWNWATVSINGEVFTRNINIDLFLYKQGWIPFVVMPFDSSDGDLPYH